MERQFTKPTRMTLAEFDRMFESVKNWGKWGPDDERGTMNYITPGKIREAASLVKSGRSVSLSIPINKEAGPDNPMPAYHFVSQGHDIPVGGGETFGMCFLGMASHGDCHTHVDAMNHVAYKGRLYNDRDAIATLTSKGSEWGSIAAYANGIIGRGVLLDVPRYRGVKWLEPGEAVHSDELEAIERAEGVHIGEGDIFVFRTGHHARRLALGSWSNDYPPAGEGKAGLDVDTIPWQYERKMAAFLPDGDGETVPAGVEGLPYPIHPLQLTSMGMLVSDSLQFEDLARVCEEEGRWEFMVVGLPLRLPGATGSPWNPVAIF
jgi:kynurenine formamidase